MTDEEIAKVEDLVNEDIKAGYVLDEQRGVPYDDAIKAGVIALFSEKYGDTVRTVRFGDSFELCGGTHTDNTLRIRLFKILSEGAIAAGVRRIEAVTGDMAVNHYKKKEAELQVLRDIFKGNRDLEKAAVSLIVENAALKKEVENFMRNKVKTIKEDLKRSMQNINGVNFIYGTVELDPLFVKTMIFELADEVDHLFAVLGNRENNFKTGLSLLISKELVSEKGWHAGKIIRDLAKCIDGGGGGQEFYATAGGKNPDGISEAIAKAEELVRGE